MNEQLSDEVAEVLAVLVQVGFDLTNTLSMIRRNAIDEGHSPETADMVCQWVITNLREELEASS